MIYMKNPVLTQPGFKAILSVVSMWEYIHMQTEVQRSTEYKQTVRESLQALII